MNDIANRTTGTALSTAMLDRLKQGIAESRASTMLAGGGKPFLRMVRGEWLYGQRDDEVQEGSSWAVNPLSIMHGWVAWTNYPPEAKTKNTKIGEVMVPVFEPKPVKPQPIEDWPFTEQRLFELKCLDGEDAGVEVQYSIASVGGMKACDMLFAELQKQLHEDPTKPCPVVRLGVDFYNHKQYGKTFTPVFEVVGWATMHGEVDAPPPPEPEPAKGRARKAPLQRQAAEPAAPAAPAAPAEPAPTAAARPGSPRRRPVGR